MHDAATFIRGFFVPEARPWVQDSQYNRAKGSRRNRKRRHQDSDSNSDTTDTENLASDNESIDSSAESQLDSDSSVSRGRPTVPIAHRAHKRSVSRNSARGGDVATAKAKKGPYEELWEKAEKDFQDNHKTTAKSFYELEKKLSQMGQSGGQKERAGQNIGFQNTLGRTQVFLNRSRKGKLPDVMKKINKFLVVLQKLSAPIGAITAADPVIAQPAWSGACILLQLCLNMTQKEEELLGAVERVVDIINLYSALKDRYSKAANSANEFFDPISKRTKSLFSNILYFQATASCHLEKHIAKRLGMNAFDLNQWRSMIEQIEDDDMKCQQALGYESHERLTEIITSMHRSLERDINLLTQRKEKIVHWLSDIRMEDYHNRVYEKSELYRDRGGWFVDAINKWIENQPKQPVYWLHGTYGMGKTFLVSRAIDKGHEIIRQNPDRQLAYYYFSEEPGGNTPEDAFRSLLSQLAITPDGTIALSIGMLYDSKPTPKLGMKQCLKEMGLLIENQVQTIIVIDAIDECQDYGRFLRLLKDVIPKDKNSVKIILSSREGTGVGSIFPSHAEQKLNERKNKDDIKHYVDVQVKKRDTAKLGDRLLGGSCCKCNKTRTAETCKDCKDRADLEDRLVKLLIEKSQGMFKWVELQISLFFQPNTPFQSKKDVEDQLQKLQRLTGELRLHKVWAQIMERNARGADAQNIAGKVYKWLLYSVLPLSRMSLTEAVSDPAGSKGNAVNITRLCSNLIDINDNIVHFAHPTIREYLEVAKDMKGINLYSPIESHKQIAITCLELMKKSFLPKLSADSFKDMEWDIRTYAAAFWPTHLREVLNVPKVDTLRDLTNDFFFRKLSQTSFKTWAKAWMKIHQDTKSSGNATTKSNAGFATKFPESYSLIVSMLSSPPDPFFAACIFGLPDVYSKSELSLEQKSQARNLNDELGVFLAIKSRRLDALQMLINAKIDVSNSWQRGMNTLHWASVHGSAKMLELLLQQEADISSINQDGATALHLAAKSAYDPLAKINLLSGLGLDPNRTSKNGSTVLHYAVQSPRVNLTMMEKLAKLSVDFKAINSGGETALHCAVQNPNYSIKAIIKLLDEIEINAKSKTGKTALSYLVDSKSSPKSKLIELFINCQANLDTVDDEGTVLHRAVRNTKCSSSLVKKLISKNSINKVDKLKRTALQCAFLPCHETSATYAIRNRTKTIVLMLLEAGADCTLTDETLGTALHYLARAPVQPAGLMKVILGKKVNIKVVDSPKLKATALHTALRYNKLSTMADHTSMKELIKATTDLSEVDYNRETVLHRAIRNPSTSLEILTLLIDGGVDINAIDITGSTALHYSVEVRDLSVTQLLLGRKANLKCLDSQRATTLHRIAGCLTSPMATRLALLVKEGLDVNARDKTGKTPLHISAQEGDKNGVAALISKFSADIQAIDDNKDTVLHFAVSNLKRSVEITNYLIGYEVRLDINQRNKNMETALHYATKKGSADVVQSLLQKEANCLAQSKDGDTPLHYAVRRRTPSAKIINLLVDTNTKVQDLTNKAGETALHAAFKNENSSDGYIALLLKGASATAKNDKRIRAIDIVTGDGKTALNRAASKGWFRAVEILLKHTADINSKEKNGWAPLSFAAERGDDLMLKKLLDAGAAVNSEAKDKTTPLHLATFNGRHECVQLLLAKKATIEAEDTFHRTPLWRAVTGNHEQVTRLLLQNKANVNAKRPDGRTLLHRAVTFGYVDVARVLLDNGAYIEAKDKENFTPLHQAIKQKNVVAIALLLEYGAKTYEPDQSNPDQFKSKLARQDALVRRLISTYELTSAAEKGDNATIQKILSNKEASNLVNSKNEKGRSPLVLAALTGQDATVTLLLDKFNADISSRADPGSTPLHCASEIGSVKVVQVLIDRKADINALEDFNRTPLHWAAQRNRLAVVKLLLRCKGIELNLTDMGSETPLLLAARKKNVEVAELLAGNDEVNVEKPDSKGKTPMYWAEAGKLEGLKALLVKRGVKVESGGAKDNV